MVDVRRPTVPDARRPVAKTRTTLPATRHIRPHAALASVRQAVAGYLLARTDWRPGTVPRNTAILGQFTWFAETHRWPETRALTNAHLRAFLAYLNTSGRKWGVAHGRASKPLSPATKNKMGSVVRTFAKWAVAEGLMPDEALRNVKWPQAPKMQDSMLAIAEVDLTRLLAQCDTRTWHGVRDHAILMLLYDTGIRRGELLAMTIGDVEAVDRAGASVSGKSGTRAVGIGATARRAVRDYLQRARYAVATEHDALWIARTGAPLGGRGLELIVRRLKDAAGIEGRIYPHRFRHTFATDFLRNGGNAYSLQIALGHASPVVTANYVHLAQADVERQMQAFSPADRLMKKRR